MTKTPTAARWRELVRQAKRTGLTTRAAEAYATLGWWGEHYGIPTPPIVSGKRSASRQRQLQQAWDRGDRRGLVVRPASSSHHTRGEAWDLPRSGALATYGAWAPYLGVRWGGNFRDRDEVHFDLGSD